MKKTFHILILQFFLVPGLSAFAQEIDSLFALSLEELMNISITTASKQEETLRDAGAVVSVITKKEIESYGAITLGEILDRTTSMYFFSGYTYRDNMLSVRGSVTPDANTNVLILINGRPFRESLTNGMNSSVYSSFPINRIDRIEIIRGPGSILYGTCALTGVVNIITEKASDNPLSAAVSYGTFNTKQANVSAGKQFGKVDISGGLTFLKSDGWKFQTEGQGMDIAPGGDPGGGDPGGMPGGMPGGGPGGGPGGSGSPTADPTGSNSIDLYKENIGADVSVRTGNLKISADYLKSKQANMGVRPIWLGTEFYTDVTRMMIDAGYEKTLTSGWNASLNATYNHLSLEKGYPTMVNFHEDGSSDDYLIEFTNYITAVTNLNVIVGGLINNQTGDYKTYKIDSETGEDVTFSDTENTHPYGVVRPYNETWWSFYAQGDYKLTSYLKLIAGVQGNKVTGQNIDLVPRVGSILNFNKNIGMKLLYGKAFRSPSQYERTARNIPDIVDNPNLGPEKIGTFETQVFLSQPKYEIYLTYFNSLQKNVIQQEVQYIDRGGMSIETPQYVNSGKVRSSGYEMEGKGFVSKAISINFSATYQSTKDLEQDKDLFGMPQFMGKVGVSYETTFGLRAGLFNTYFGKGKDINESDTNVANPAPNDFNSLSANIQYELSKLLKLKSKIHVGVYGTNLLNEDIYYQEFIYRKINSLPGRSGRAINATINIRL